MEERLLQLRLENAELENKLLRLKLSKAESQRVGTQTVDVVVLQPNELGELIIKAWNLITFKNPAGTQHVNTKNTHVGIIAAIHTKI